MTRTADHDAIRAAVDLVGRTGARRLEFGSVDDSNRSDWWASALYQGTKIIVEGQSGPAAALEALARRVLTGGRCGACHGLIILADTAAESRRAAANRLYTWQCHWYRDGSRWKRGCE